MEMTHRKIMAPSDAHIRDALAILIQRLDSSNYIIQVLLSQTAAVDCETNHIRQFSLLLRGFQIIFHGIVAKLGNTDAIAADQLQREALAREGIVAALAVKKLVHVDVHCVSAGRKHNALDAGLIKAFRQVIALGNALMHIVEVTGFIQTDSQRHDVATGHTAIGIVAVAGDLLDL